MLTTPVTKKPDLTTDCGENDGSDSQTDEAASTDPITTHQGKKHASQPVNDDDLDVDLGDGSDADNEAFGLGGLRAADSPNAGSW